MTTYTKEEREFWERVFCANDPHCCNSAESAHEADLALEEWRKRFGVEPVKSCETCRYNETGSPLCAKCVGFVPSKWEPRNDWLESGDAENNMAAATAYWRAVRVVRSWGN